MKSQCSHYLNGVNLPVYLTTSYEIIPPQKLTTGEIYARANRTQFLITDSSISALRAPSPLSESFICLTISMNLLACSSLFNSGMLPF